MGEVTGKGWEGLAEWTDCQPEKADHGERFEGLEAQLKDRVVIAAKGG